MLIEPPERRWSGLFECTQRARYNIIAVKVMFMAILSLLAARHSGSDWGSQGGAAPLLTKGLARTASKRRNLAGA
eukprot:5735244-Amphidinium_carterae.1